MKCKFKIPKSFKLMGQTIKVKYSDKLLINDDDNGQAHFRRNLIKLDSTYRTREQVNTTFLHELMHFIFHALGKWDLRDNEELVHAVAGLLSQYFETAKYK